MKPRALVAVMGPYPMAYEGGNTRDDFKALVLATTLAFADLYEIPDLVKTVGATRAYNPDWGPKHRGIHAMRCHAAEKARKEGWDYLFIVENDVKLAADTLDRLLARGKDHIVPRHEFPDFPPIRAMVYGPVPAERAWGLHRLDWCGYPATLYRMAAFQAVDPMFVGGGECFDYARWHEAGIETWMDLDVEAVNLRLAGPHQAMLAVPGSITNHLNKGGVLCDGLLYEYRSREEDDDEVFHLACRGCAWRVDFKPPEGYRAEALRISRVLGQKMAGPRAVYGQRNGDERHDRVGAYARG